jgi:hypothetical protein
MTQFGLIPQGNPSSDTDQDTSGEQQENPKVTFHYNDQTFSRAGDGAGTQRLTVTDLVRARSASYWTNVKQGSEIIWLKDNLLTVGAGSNQKTLYPPFKLDFEPQNEAGILETFGPLPIPPPEPTEEELQELELQEKRDKIIQGVLKIDFQNLVTAPTYAGDAGDDPSKFQSYYTGILFQSSGDRTTPFGSSWRVLPEDVTVENLVTIDGLKYYKARNPTLGWPNTGEPFALPDAFSYIRVAEDLPNVSQPSPSQPEGMAPLLEPLRGIVALWETIPEDALEEATIIKSQDNSNTVVPNIVGYARLGNPKGGDPIDTDNFQFGDSTGRWIASDKTKIVEIASGVKVRFREIWKYGSQEMAGQGIFLPGPLTRVTVPEYNVYSKINQPSDLSTPPIQPPPPPPPEPITDFDEFVVVYPNISENQLLINAGDNASGLFQAMLDGGSAQIDVGGNTGIANLNFEKAVEIDKWYEDSVFSSPLAYSKREIELTGTSARVMFADVQPNYNFYIQKYENMISNPTISENILPNIYSIIVEKDYIQSNSVKGEYDILNPSVKKLNSLDGVIYVPNFLSLKGANDPSQMQNTIGNDKASGQYYDVWSKQYAATNKKNLKALSNKFDNIIFTHSNTDLLKSADDNKEMFPMYVEIEFATTRETLFGNFLEQADISSMLLDEFVRASSASLRDSDYIELEQEPFPDPSNPVDAGDLFGLPPNKGIFPRKRKSLDVIDWLNNEQSLFADNSLNEVVAGLAAVGEKPYDISLFPNLSTYGEDLQIAEGQNSVFMGSVENSLKLSRNSKFSFYKTLMLAILRSKINEVLIENTRTYQQVLQGKLAKNETVFYRIEKRRGGQEGEIIQNIYLPNSSKIDVHKYIDTQVKYGEEYTYTIYSYVMVYGTEYKYVEEVKTGIPSGLKIKTRPKLNIVEVPYFTYTNKMVDSPPVMPDVEIVPFRGVNNKFKINFNSNVGSFVSHPEYIEGSELDAIAKIRKAQDRYQDEPIRYESDDQARVYEVWRTDRKPVSYQDFAGKKILDYRPSSDIETGQQPTSGAIIEKVQPNKKYWYVFRSVDVHENVSYPSALYEVELVDDEGLVYLNVDVVEFAEKVPKTIAKQAKRMLNIIPNLGHVLVNEQLSGIDDLESVADKWATDIYLGVKEQSLWGKKFKIRITSKNTGKKVDLNITFEHEQIKINPNPNGTTAVAVSKIQTTAGISNALGFDPNA